jgi:hypothetical protein
MKFYPLIIALFLSAAYSCKKENPTPEPEPTPVTPPSNTNAGSLRLEFKNMVDTNDLVFNKYYLNPAGDSFKVTKFNYYISNIVLMDDKFENFRVPESYYLVEHSVATSSAITIQNIPPGSYRSVMLMIGVDSLRNCSGAQSGALDVSRQMFWTWNSGYIFMKLEGSAPKAGGAIVYHIGGYKGPDKTQRLVNLELSGLAKVSSTSQPTITLKVDMNECFKTPNLINFATNSNIMTPGAASRTFADNYADMITLKSLKNP